MADVADVAAPVGGPSASTRVTVVVFLLALVTCGVLEIEAWPFSGFKLFSQARTGTEVRWELVAVDQTGAEGPVDLSAMGRGFRQSRHQLRDLAEASGAERAAACDGWFGAAAGAGDPVAFRVYRSVYERSSPAATSLRTAHVLRFTCERP